MGDISEINLFDSKKSISWGGLSIDSEEGDGDLLSSITCSWAETLVNNIFPICFWAFVDQQEKAMLEELGIEIEDEPEPERTLVTKDKFLMYAIEQKFNEFDADHSGTIDLHEFIAGKKGVSIFEKIIL